MLLLARFGGLYLDVDVRPPAAGSRGTGGGPRSLDSLWAAYPSATVIMFEESLLTPQDAEAAGRMHRIRGGEPEECQRIANYMMAAAPATPPLSDRDSGSVPARNASPATPLLQRILDLMLMRAAMPVVEDYDVLYTTGPALVTEAVYAHATAIHAAFKKLSPLRTESTVGLRVLQSACRKASGLLHDADIGGSRAETICIVERPIDQDYFDHMTNGNWRQ